MKRYILVLGTAIAVNAMSPRAEAIEDACFQAVLTTMRMEAVRDTYDLIDRAMTKMALTVDMSPDERRLIRAMSRTHLDSKQKAEDTVKAARSFWQANCQQENKP